MASIGRNVDRAKRTLARAARRRGPLMAALRAARRGLVDRSASFADALHDARRSYAEKRDARDMDHLRVLLGFWLTPESNCVDIGANQGHVLRMIQERAPHGRHLAFEPIPDLAQQLRRSFPDVTVYDVALSDAPGTAEFTVVEGDDRHGYSGITRNLAPLPESWTTRSTTVETARLDDLVPADYVPRFIKIDVESSELEVLRGGRRTLADHRPILFMEHGVAQETGELHELLTELGYSIYDVDGGGPYDGPDAMLAAAHSPNGRLWNWVCL